MINYKEDLTPVHELEGIFYKRDDLYAPYGTDFVTGGKIRQCRDLIKVNLDYIKKQCNSTIATASSIHSPQAVIVSKVAEEFELKSIIGFGNTTIKKALKNKSIKLCEDLGSELIVLSESQGFNNVLYHNLDKLSKDRPLFKVLFGYAAQTYRSSIIGKIAEQIQNVECDTLYVPLGSGITFTGILEGYRLYNKKFKLVALQPFGYDRKKEIHSNLQGMVWEYNYDYYCSPKYPYNKELKKNIGFELDSIYESKAYEMMMNTRNKKEKSCFWLIGNSNYIRGKA